MFVNTAVKLKLSQLMQYLAHKKKTFVVIAARKENFVRLIGTEEHAAGVTRCVLQNSTTCKEAYMSPDVTSSRIARRWLAITDLLRATRVN